MLTGILVANKTYGRDKKGRLLYLCIADTLNDASKQNYLVPFNNPSTKNFNKAPTNYYIVFIPLTDTLNGHRLGQLDNCLGTVDSWQAYSQYELYKRNLYGCPAVYGCPAAAAAPSFNDLDKAVSALSPVTGTPEPHSVISIDPDGCTDIDDAFSFVIEGSVAYLRIHIANVPLLLETHNLWNKLTFRTTTVYMPTCKVPMLPKHLSNNVCSLLEGTVRPTIMITFAFNVDTATGSIKTLRHTTPPIATFAHIKKNYTYNDNIPQLDRLLEAARLLEPNESVSDTHDLIAVFMMAFNKVCAPLVPIYRNCVNSAPSTAWFNYELQSFAASYDVVNRGHASIGYTYTHITSPIRRLADLVNMTALLYGVEHAFVQKWIANIDHINYYCKQARKAQQNAELYKALSEGAATLYTGVHVAGTGVVYLIELRLFVSVGNQLVPEGTHQYEIYMFHKEFTLKRKIRIMCKDI